MCVDKDVGSSVLVLWWLVLGAGSLAYPASDRDRETTTIDRHRRGCQVEFMGYLNLCWLFFFFCFCFFVSALIAAWVQLRLVFCC